MNKLLDQALDSEDFGEQARLINAAVVYSAKADEIEEADEPLALAHQGGWRAC